MHIDKQIQIIGWLFKSRLKILQRIHLNDALCRVATMSQAYPAVYQDNNYFTKAKTLSETYHQSQVAPFGLRRLPKILNQRKSHGLVEQILYGSVLPF